MKKNVIFLLLSFVFLTSPAASFGSTQLGNEPESEKETGKDHPIVGRWEYEKTIRPDGSEVVELIITEHYYADGTLLYINVWLTPQPVHEFSDSREEIKKNFKQGYGGIASYNIEKGKDKDRLTYTVDASCNKEKIGSSPSIDITVDEDTLIFYPGNGSQVILKRVVD